MPYGPNNEYPYKTDCGTCGEPVWVHWSSRTEKVYKTVNKAWGALEEEKKPIFHVCKKEGVIEVMDEKLHPTDKYLAELQNLNRIAANIYNALVVLGNAFQCFNDRQSF